MKKIVTVGIFVFAFAVAATAQKKLTIFNPSFEENKPTNQNYPGYMPPPWGIASVITNTGTGSCNVAPSPDMNPRTHYGGKPDHQNFMIGAAATGGPSATCHGGEAFYQILCKPMQQGVQYSFKIRVMVTSFFPSPPVVSVIDSAIFGVYGANSIPASNQFTNPEVLYTAKVTDTAWTTYTVTFTPANGTYDYLIIGGYANLSTGSGFSGQSYLQFDNITDVDSTCGMSITSKDTTICSGSCASIVVNSQDALQPIQYSWNGGPFVTGDSTRIGTNAICGLTNTTSYTVVAIDAKNDTAETVIKVTVQQPSVTAIPKFSSFCLGDSVQLQATGATTYNWSPVTGLSSATISNPIAKPSSPGIFDYVVTGTDALGCVDKDTVRVEVVNPIPTAYIGPDLVICPPQGDSVVILTATGGNLFTWSTGETTQSIIVRPSQTTVYSVIVGNSCGNATAFAEIKITVACGIDIPNVITPNGDPDNQYFEIEHMDLYPNSRLEIYDRWGLKMFESDNYINDWDGGNYKTGKPVPDGVYYYILYLTDKEKTIYTGFIQVIRG